MLHGSLRFFLAAVECLVAATTKKQVPLPFFISCHCALTQLKDIIQLPTTTPTLFISIGFTRLIAHTHILKVTKLAPYTAVFNAIFQMPYEFPNVPQNCLQWRLKLVTFVHFGQGDWRRRIIVIHLKT